MSIVTASDGVPLAVRAFPGHGPVTVAFVHATGFCQALWDPVVEDMRAGGRSDPMITWDQRGHGASGPPPGDIDWWDLGRDALEVLARVEGPVVGVGHSSGAAALLEAEILAPGRFASIVAIEPIVFPPPYGSGHDHPLAISARKRRASFPSREVALANFVEKPVFAGWDSRAMAAYVDCGLVDDGKEVSLACHPEVEAAFYAAAGLHRAWDRLGEVAAPVTLVAGESSDSHPAAFVEAQAARFPQASMRLIADAGHFVPMEQPARVAEIIDQVVVAAIESINSS